jgi:hypothetical protein
VLRADNVDMLAQRKREFVFKPAQGFASRGLLDSAAVGRARLRHLVNRGERYVAQRRITKAYLESRGRPPLDRLPRLGVSGRNYPHFGTRFAAARPAGSCPAAWVVADLRFALTAGTGEAVAMAIGQRR